MICYDFGSFLENCLIKVLRLCEERSLKSTFFQSGRFFSVSDKNLKALSGKNCNFYYDGDTDLKQLKLNSLIFSGKLSEVAPQFVVFVVQNYLQSHVLSL